MKKPDILVLTDEMIPVNVDTCGAGVKAVETKSLSNLIMIHNLSCEAIMEQLPRIISAFRMNMRGK